MTYEMGARFTNKFYVTLSIDPDDSSCDVTVEVITDEGEKNVITGSVVWDE